MTVCDVVGGGGEPREPWNVCERNTHVHGVEWRGGGFLEFGTVQRVDPPFSSE